MANKLLFRLGRGRRADVRNHAGGLAYARTNEQALAQLAATGCLNRTFYMNEQDQLQKLIDLARTVDPRFLAQTAIHARTEGFMKDTPAALMAVLSKRDPVLFRQAFGRVIDTGKMVRTFVQIMRSGAVGRQSLGTGPKRMVQGWLNAASDREILSANVGQDPSLADVIKMVHPKARDAQRNALFAWVVGRPVDTALLPVQVRQYLAFQAGSAEVPDVPFQMLASLPLTVQQWADIALSGGWHMVRMNLNTFLRHGVFELPGMAEKIAARLADARAIGKARVFPYQLLAAYKHADPALPHVVIEALQDAMEIAVGNVPKLPGVTVVCPDVSGSMTWASVTGHRKGSTSKVRCIDVAGLIAASVLRQNRQAIVLPFEHDVVDVRLNARDTVMTNARMLASVGGGGTACSAPIARLIQMRTRVDTVIMVSDNESWADGRHRWNKGTPLMAEWERLKKRNPNARLVCMDLTPNHTTPAHDRPDVLNIGGFSDRAFDLIQAFAQDRLTPDHWVGQIEQVEI